MRAGCIPGRSVLADMRSDNLTTQAARQISQTIPIRNDGVTRVVCVVNDRPGDIEGGAACANCRLMSGSN